MRTSRPSTRTRAPVGPSRTRSLFQVFASFSAAISTRQKSVRLVLMPARLSEMRSGGPKGPPRGSRVTVGSLRADLGRDELRGGRAPAGRRGRHEYAGHVHGRADDDAGADLR